MPNTDRELEADAEQLVGLLRRLIRRVYSLDPEDPTSDLPVAQVRVCGMLCEGPRAVSTLAKELGISASAVTQVADRLVAAGLAERLADEEDRRVRNLALTPRGLEVTLRRRERRVQSAREVLANLAPGERKTVLSTLERLGTTGANRPEA